MTSDFIQNEPTATGAILAQELQGAEPQDDFELVTDRPAIILEPVRIADLVNLIIAARSAAISIDRYVQFRPVLSQDVTALNDLKRALAPFNGHYFNVEPR
jgi:hypothetical protein